MLMHPEMVNEKVNPRSITNFFNSIKSIKSFSTELPLIQMIGEGSVGVEFSTAFVLFVNNKLDKLISPKNIITMNWDVVRPELIKCIGVDSAYRADIASVLATRVLNYSLTQAISGTINKPILDRLGNILTDTIFATDLCFYITKGLIGSPEKAKFQGILLNPKIANMAVK
jgi:hypothetical protein